MKRFLQLESRDIVAVVSVSMFMVQLDAAVLAIALPKIAASFGLPTVSLSLAITIYLTMLVAMLPISGWAADRFGPRRVFLFAAFGFGLFSLACALAPGFWPFILARALQGACASLMTPVARLILLKRTRKAELVDALAITAMPMLIAPTVGPSLGGFIVDYGRWEYIFLLNVPIALGLVALTRWRVPEIPPEHGQPLDRYGAILLSTTLIAMLTGLDRLASDAGSTLPWVLLATGSFLAALTLRHLRRHPQPIVSLEPLKIPSFRTTAIGAGAIIRLPGRSILFALPLMFQIGFGLSAFAAGLLLMVLNGGDLVTKPFIKPAFDRYGYRATVVFGSLLGLAGMAIIAMADGSAMWLGLTALALLAAGVSRSAVFTGMASLTFTTLGKRDMTSGNVLASISMQLFNAIAITGTALVLGLSAQLRGSVEPDLGDFRIALMLAIALGLAATIALWRRAPRDLEEVHAEDPI